MAKDGKDFTFIWSLKNFSFSFYDTHYRSQFFRVDAMCGTEWFLTLNNNNKDNVCCYIERKADPGPDNSVLLDYELSFLDGDGSVLRSELFTKKAYKKGHCDENATVSAEKEEILKFNKDMFIPEDVLTMRCRMWCSKYPLLQSGCCFAETRIETECLNYVGTIEKFSLIQPNSNTLVRIKPSSTKTFFSSLRFSIKDDGKLAIEIKPTNYGHRYMYRCEIFIRDASGNRIKSGEGEFYDTNPQKIFLSVLKEHLTENKGLYLTNDILTIEFSVTFPTGKEIEEPVETDKLAEEKEKETEKPSILDGMDLKSTAEDPIEKIDEQDNKCDFKETQMMISKADNTTSFSDENKSDGFSTLLGDYLSLFKNGILWDVEIKTPTEIFPAHMAVLSARSPVFKAMFTNHMIEKMTHCVKIDDLDADTVRRMLLFIYSDDLDDLEYESAKSLYFAADKYLIVSLTYRCINFFKQNLQHSNYSEILQLAYEHQDKELKNIIRDYIANEGEAVLLAQKWKDLVESHPQLTTEILLDLYMNK